MHAHAMRTRSGLGEGNLPLLHPHQGDDPFGVSARVAPPPPPPPPPAAFPLSSTTFLSLVGDKHVEAMVPPLSQSFRTDGRMDVFLQEGWISCDVGYVLACTGSTYLLCEGGVCCHVLTCISTKAISVSNLQENMHRTRWSFSMQRKGRAECRRAQMIGKEAKEEAFFALLLPSSPRGLAHTLQETAGG